LKKLFFVPDCHHPYVDRRAWKLCLAALTAFQPDVVVVLGDFIDNYAVTQHDKSYGRKSDFQWEIDMAIGALNQLEDACTTASKYFIEGNHEDRWPRYLAKIAPQDNRRNNNMRDILELDKHGWKFTPYKEFTTIGKLNLTHDTGKAGKNAIHQALDDFQSNVVIGHLHRMGVVYSGSARGKSHVAACFGWLGDVKQVDYMHRVKANRDWQLGFGTGYMLPSGQVHLQAVPIVDYKCVVEGKILGA